jgi:hypothetical protein
VAGPGRRVVGRGGGRAALVVVDAVATGKDRLTMKKRFYGISSLLLLLAAAVGSLLAQGVPSLRIH